MSVIQEKPSEEVFAREPQIYPLGPRATNVAEPERTKNLGIALRLVGLTFIVGLYTLIIVWPAGWAWHTGHSHYLPHYLQMILGIYATLGVFCADCEPQPARTPEPDLVRRVVQRGARGHYGSAVLDEL
jgi:hypothetical protein